MSTFDYADFEDSLAQELKESHGFNVQRQFNVPGRREIRFDLYISEPIRSFIEIKFGGSFNTGLEPFGAIVDAVRQWFGYSVIPLIIHIYPEKKPGHLIRSGRTKQKELYFVLEPDWDGKSELPTAEIANALNDFFLGFTYHRNRAHPDSPGSSDKHSVNPSPLDDVFSSFRNFLKEEEYQNLELEVNAFGREYESQHYAACATRIGRTIEFVLYGLSSAWNVKVNKQSIELVDKTQNALDQVKALYIRLANASDRQERSDLESRVTESINNLNARIVDLSRNMSLVLDTRDIDSPPETNAILRSISREYGKGSTTEHEIIRDETKAIGEGENSPLRMIYDLRNKASHADWSGKYQDVAKSDVDMMIEQIRIVIFKLVNIGEAIQKLKQST